MTTETVTRERIFRPNAIPLEIMRIYQHSSCPIHTHEFSELVVVLRGTGIHVTPTGEYPIGAGDVFVLHGDQAHGYLNTEDLGLVNILFNMDELGLPRADITALPGFHVLFTVEPKFRARDRFENRLRLTPDNLRHIEALVDRLEAECRLQSPGWGFTAIAYFMLIAAELSRYYSRVEDAAVQPLLGLGRILSYLEQHYMEPITLDDLAQAGCLSRRTLTRAFKSATGYSPIEYLIRLRIKHAVELLQDAESSVTDVAFQVGFRDSNYFSRQFRLVVGRSPRSYRAAPPRG